MLQEEMAAVSVRLPKIQRLLPRAPPSHSSVVEGTVSWRGAVGCRVATAAGSSCGWEVWSKCRRPIVLSRPSWQMDLLSPGAIRKMVVIVMLGCGFDHWVMSWHVFFCFGFFKLKMFLFSILKEFGRTIPVDLVDLHFFRDRAQPGWNWESCRCSLHPGIGLFFCRHLGKRWSRHLGPSGLWWWQHCNPGSVTQCPGVAESIFCWLTLHLGNLLGIFCIFMTTWSKYQVCKQYKLHHPGPLLQSEQMARSWPGVHTVVVIAVQFRMNSGTCCRCRRRMVLLRQSEDRVSNWFQTIWSCNLPFWLVVGRFRVPVEDFEAQEMEVLWPGAMQNVEATAAQSEIVFKMSSRCSRQTVLSLRSWEMGQLLHGATWICWVDG